MAMPGETEAGSAGKQPCRGIARRAHRDDDHGRGNERLAPTLHPIGSIDPDALKIPARRAASTLTRSPRSPVPAEPAHYHTGLRAGIITGIEWEWVDLKAANIRLPKGVHNKRNPAVVPIYGDMGAELEMAKAEHDEFWPACPFVVHIRGRQVNPDITHQSGWRSACKAADVDGLLFHDLRRSAIRNMRRAGIPENEAMAISGHRTRSVFQRYDIVSEKDIGRAAAKLEALQVRERAGAEEKRAVQ